MKLSLSTPTLVINDENKTVLGSISASQKIPNLWLFAYSEYNKFELTGTQDEVLTKLSVILPLINVEGMIDDLGVSEPVEKTVSAPPKVTVIEDVLGYKPLEQGTELYEGSDKISDRQKLAFDIAETLCKEDWLFVSDVEQRQNRNKRGYHYSFQVGQLIDGEVYKGAVDVYSESFIVVWSEYIQQNSDNLLFSEEDDGKILYNDADSAIELFDLIKGSGTKFI